MSEPISFLSSTPSKIFLLFFVFMALLAPWGALHNFGNFNYLTKLTTITSLLIFYYINIRDAQPGFWRQILIGIVFAIAGDAFLISGNGTLFLMGLGGFGLAYGHYAYAYYLSIKKSGVKLTNNKLLYIPLPYIGWSVFIMIMLAPKAGSMLPPLGIYFSVDITMGIMAGMRYGMTTLGSFVCGVIGTASLILSDSVIGFTMFKFVEDPFAQWAIMLTYYLGQFCIVSSAILHFEEKKKINENSGLLEEEQAY